MNQLGFNTGYVEELYRHFLEDPESVSENWREFFADYRPNESFVAAEESRPAPTPAVVEEPAPVALRPAPAVVRESGDGATIEPIIPASAPEAEGVTLQPLRGAAARIVENMEASLGVPTATSVRAVPVKLMAENRRLANDYMRYIGGEKVSFTHIVAWAIVKGLKKYFSLNTSLRHEDGAVHQVVPAGMNLGIAIDIERKGKRSLLVPNIKGADRMRFSQFLGVYNDIVQRSREGKLEVSDFVGTTATITNPGMIGTGMSVPRLMPGQGAIIAVGSIGYPPEYYAYSPDVVSRLGISEVMTLTSTYDHRVIQGAESGAFLSYVADLILGKEGFYEEIFSDLCIPYQPFTVSHDTTPRIGMGDADTEMDMIHKQAGVLQLIRAYRVRGHLQADVNPLGYKWTYHPELDPARYGLTIWDLDRKFITGGLGGLDVQPLREILNTLRQTYSRKIGIEFMHISDMSEKEWLQERIEKVRNAEPLKPEERIRILQKLNAAEAFERFLHTKYVGHKRFSLEGAETAVPILDAVLNDAAMRGVQEVAMGMAHRGRLNVLANILNKPYELIFSEFEGSIDPSTTQGSGDVKYHLGARGLHLTPDNQEVQVTLSSNPSHLEAVNPVVEGMVRARQDIIRHQLQGDQPADYFDTVLPILIHGDAAFAGQGVVAETLNLSQLRGYKTGGTIHLVINNQIGFTTTPTDARSSTYATDIARMIQAPIFHVNGDDPEACVRVARVALEYRQDFNKDVVIDLLCYRVHGHNEGDEPTYTQPLLYKKIEEKRSVRKLYTELLLRRGDMAPDEAERMLDDYRSRLQEAFDRTKGVHERDPREAVALIRKRKAENRLIEQVDTRPDPAHIERAVEVLSDLPKEFNVHKKLVRQFERRKALFYDEKQVDWAFAESLAYGTLIQEGYTIRLSGQDSRRGTFSHRHAVLYDQEDGSEYTPLNKLAKDAAELLVFDSLLSEYAVCGFEYGYSIANPEALVIWEAQFGDFGNGAQIIFDQFLSAAEEKWGQRSSLVVLLPHGYEGQGPEHSSARLERFLQLCAEDNLTVCTFTTPANFFHALRRQVKRANKKPMIVMAPKSLLRHPGVVSAPEDLLNGQYREVLPAVADPSRVSRHVFCGGKVYLDLMAALSKDPAQQEGVAVTRIEQFYPWSEEQIRAELERYKGAAETIWLQEEPANMGAWTFLRHRFDDLLEEIHGGCSRRIQYAGRRAGASPASGSGKVYQLEQDELIARASGIEH